MSLLVIDGISGSGKSLLLKNIQKRLVEDKSNYSKVIISEHLTERYFEDKDCNKNSVEHHILNILNIANSINFIQNTSKFKNQSKVVTSIAERLFLTFISKGLLDITFFKNNKHLIKELEIKHFLLYIPEDLIYKRLESTLNHRNSYWKNYIDSLGGLEKSVKYFTKQQRKMLESQKLLSNYMHTDVIEVNNINILQNTDLLTKLIE